MLKKLAELRCFALAILILALSCACTADSTGDCEGFSWLPDSQQIAFTDSQNIYVMKADGSQVHQLRFPKSLEGYAPSWSPDGKYIVFVVQQEKIDPEDATGQIYIMSINNPQEIKVLANKGLLPQWSPDGKGIVFSSYQSSHDSYWEIYTADTNGSKLIRLANNSDVYGPVLWSPDSKKILFPHSPSVEKTEIYIADTQGLEKPKKLVNGSDPAWSVGGKKIAFFDGSDVFIMNPDGSKKERLYRLPTDRAYKHGLQWSYYNKKLFIWYIACKDHKKFSFDICELKVLSMNTKSPYHIQQIFSFNAVGDAPVWSPNRKKILFNSRGFIYTVDTDGSGLKRVK